ncbi:MAG: Crp/Fnr family transcriptional regulator [Anaerostipes sp.]|jgi:CRP-like cAMP-binding protein|nr:Crp/Fnr family transcriptional regulator [Anaerostipes sp.]
MPMHTKQWKSCVLFQGMDDCELEEIIKQIGNHTKTYQKGEFIFGEDTKPTEIYILLDGKVSIGKDTPSGKHIIITQIEEEGDMFGEVYLFIKKESYEMYALAEEETKVLAISKSVFGIQSELKRNLVLKLQENLMRIFASKAYQMNQKIKILGGASLREKIVNYLFEFYPKETEILLPRREEWAAYLNVTRPSLSRELGKMQKEGLIEMRGKKLYIRGELTPTFISGDN